MSKVGRRINIVNDDPEFENDFCNKKWNEQIPGYKIRNSACKTICSGIKKMFKDLPVLKCSTPYKQAIKYYILCLAVYQALIEVIFDRFININVDNAQWTHEAILA